MLEDSKDTAMRHAEGNGMQKVTGRYHGCSPGKRQRQRQNCKSLRKSEKTEWLEGQWCHKPRVNFSFLKDGGMNKIRSIGEKNK